MMKLLDKDINVRIKTQLSRILLSKKAVMPAILNFAQRMCCHVLVSTFEVQTDKCARNEWSTLYLWCSWCQQTLLSTVFGRPQTERSVGFMVQWSLSLSSYLSLCSLTPPPFASTQKRPPTCESNAMRERGDQVMPCSLDADERSCCLTRGLLLQ